MDCFFEKYWKWAAGCLIPHHSSFHHPLCRLLLPLHSTSWKVQTYFTLADRVWGWFVLSLLELLRQKRFVYWSYLYNIWYVLYNEYHNSYFCSSLITIQTYLIVSHVSGFRTLKASLSFHISAPKHTTRLEEIWVIFESLLQTFLWQEHELNSECVFKHWVISKP